VFNLANSVSTPAKAGAMFEDRGMADRRRNRIVEDYSLSGSGWPEQHRYRAPASQADAAYLDLGADRTALQLLRPIFHRRAQRRFISAWGRAGIPE
jgi:hypothetical protein